MFSSSDASRRENNDMLDAERLITPKPRPAFGRWLLAQQSRSDAVGRLAQAAAHDPKFPRDGAPQDVSAHLNRLQAEHDMHQALEDAELDWSCY
jgi:hypothetical protein